MRKLLLTAAALLAALVLLPAAQAETLRWGSGAEPSSLDPFYHNLGPNNAMARHFFDRLIQTDDSQRLHPGLAASWKALDDTTWQFDLRKDVQFSDGSAFTAEDVLFSIDRVAKVPNSPSAFTIYTKQIKTIAAPGPFRIVITTAEPYPLMPNDLATINIMSHRAAAGKTTEQLNAGDGLVGTGPYKLVEWVRGDHLTMERNPHYWGEKPLFDKVIYRPMTNGSARVAALLAGDVDFIDDVPTADIARLKGNSAFVVSQGVSNRVIYLHLDQDREVSPFVKTADGKNALRKWEVRAAISHAINRPAIVERVMEGVAIPAGQLLPKGFFGHNPDLHPDAYDPALAKQLLAKAGYPHGFKLTLHGPNDRYINDAKIAQAVAQMLTRVGIDTDVVTMPRNVYFPAASKREFSFILVGWGSGTGEASSPLRSLLATYDKAKGMGPSNRGRYSNPKMDALLEQALRTVDDAKREKLLQDATAIAMKDYGIIPLHYQVNTWATKKGLCYRSRTDEASLAMNVHKEGECVQ
jgi:peptide/nickel transport system substrate-binding protein